MEDNDQMNVKEYKDLFRTYLMTLLELLKTNNPDTVIKHLEKIIEELKT